ncbi:YncE family protein [Streptomyces sp. NPDC093225]|uniref:YncE family protein n=1 Tax=Streptomyces sp. NPDC093225 TaxID=3366034 RepID=UPI00380E6A8D
MVATIPVGADPVGVAVDVHDQVFVTNVGHHTVSVVKSTTNTVTTTVNVGFWPEGVATDPQFGVFVADNGGNAVSVIDRFNALVATLTIDGPSGPPPNTTRIAVDHLAGRAYVTNRTSDTVSAVHNGGTPFVLPEFQVLGALGVAVDPTDHRVYVTQPEAHTVSVIDAAAHDVTAVVPVLQQPTGIAIDAPRHRAYVANSGTTAVSVIDLTTGGVSNVDVAAHPIAVAVDARGDAYVSLSDDTVQVIDAGSHGVVATVPVGSGPSGLAFEPHSKRVYVANSGDGTLSVIDTAGG